MAYVNTHIAVNQEEVDGLSPWNLMQRPVATRLARTLCGLMHPVPGMVRDGEAPTCVDCLRLMAERAEALVGVAS